MGAPRYSHPITVRYYEVDQQGVVFNMWYLAYFDDAMTGLLAHGGLPYVDMLAAGYDMQLVHTELDWVGSLGWGDSGVVDVSVARVGRTSFAVEFLVRVGERRVVTGTTTYVVVAADGTGKRPVPPALLAALGTDGE